MPLTLSTMLRDRRHTSPRGQHLGQPVTKIVAVPDARARACVDTRVDTFVDTRVGTREKLLTEVARVLERGRPTGGIPSSAMAFGECVYEAFCHALGQRV